MIDFPPFTSQGDSSVSKSGCFRDGWKFIGDLMQVSWRLNRNAAGVTDELASNDQRIGGRIEQRPVPLHRL